MKKISFRVRNFDKEQFLTFNIDNESELDEELLDYLEEEEPEGIVPVIFEEGEEFDTFSYDITDRIHVCELSNQEINAEMVLMVLRGIVNSLLDMSEYRIPLSYLVLNRQYIYIDSDYKVEFVCIPLTDLKEEADLNNFFRNFMASLRFDPEENGDYVAKILSYVNNRDKFNLRNFLELIEEWMDRFGIEIPEGGSNEIYAEYKEVDDSVEQSAESSEEDSISDSPETVSFEDNNDNENLENNEESVTDDSIDNEYSEAAWNDETIDADSNSKETDLSESNTETEESEYVANASYEYGYTEGETELADEDENKNEEDIISDDQSLSTDESLNNPESDEETVSDEDESKKSVFKTKEAIGSVGVVIEDDFDAFMAEHDINQVEEGLKIRKDIKINRASIVQNTQEELAEDVVESVETEEDKTNDKKVKPSKRGRKDKDKKAQDLESEESKEGGSIISQTIANVASNVTSSVPKVNPYLIRVNTDERIMINKQTFKIGKAGMGVDYTIDGNGAISRVHAIITYKDGEYYIKDNKSTNHTFVDGKNVDDGEVAQLTDGCKIVLGDEEFIFKL